MIVVSDTTAITTLLKARMEQLLPDLFGAIIIPEAVRDELLVFHSQLPRFLSVQPAPQRITPTSGLGRGEADAIVLALAIHADLLLTDDLKARSVAATLNLPCTGLLGVLIRAKERRFISSVKNSVETLEHRAGLYLSDAVKIEALRLARET